MRKSFLTILLSAFIAIIAIFTESSCSAHKNSLTYEDSIANVAAQRMLQSADFVLTGTQLTIGSRTFTVTPNTNFVLVQGEKAIVQASPRIAGGPNGVGGITFAGTISGYKSEVNKKGQTLVKFHIMAPIGSATVSVVLEKGYNGATANVSGDFNGRNILLRGKIQSTGTGNYIQGRSR